MDMSMDAMSAPAGGKGGKGGKRGKAAAAKAASSRPKRRTSARSYESYISRVIKQIHADKHSISQKSMSTLNSMVNDVIGMVSHEASRLAEVCGSKTIQARDIQSAVRLCFPRELAKHAVSEGTKAVTKYTAKK